MIKTPKNNVYSSKKMEKGAEGVVPVISKLEQKGQIGKFESGSSSENFTNIYQNNLASLTKQANSFVLDNMNDDQLEMIVREGEEIDESIERLENSIFKLRGQNVDIIEEGSDLGSKTVVPKLDFKRLKSQKKRKKRKKNSALYSQFGFGKYNK